MCCHIVHNHLLPQQTPSAITQISVVRIFLGVGILLQAAVILRFVSYFQQFNVSRPFVFNFVSLLSVCIKGGLPCSKYSPPSTGKVHSLCPDPVPGFHDVRMVGPGSIPLQGQLPIVIPSVDSRLYLTQFVNFGESFHALFTMMHGDDLFSTYQGITAADDMEAYIFSQFFFTIFLMLFIYAMLNLMISLIMESYEESQVCCV